MLVAASCPSAPAAIVQKADAGIMAPARDLGLRFPKTPTILDVLLDVSGRPTRITMLESSGIAHLDHLAIRMAKATSYAPASRDCRYRTAHVRFVQDWQQLQRELDGGSP